MAREYLFCIHDSHITKDLSSPVSGFFHFHLRKTLNSIIETIDQSVYHIFRHNFTIFVHTRPLTAGGVPLQRDRRFNIIRKIATNPRN